jgi:hypothetical protein
MLFEEVRELPKEGKGHKSKAKVLQTDKCDNIEENQRTY